MKPILFNLLQRVFALQKLQLVKLPGGLPPDINPDFLSIYEKCKPYTMTSLERMYSLYESVKYLEKKGIKGDFVECGVWKGGSAMVMAETLLQCGNETRKIYLYDTYKGMTKPGKEDFTIEGSVNTSAEWQQKRKAGYNSWAYSPLSEVQQNLFSTGYPAENLIYVTGMVEKTIPQITPRKIALLRLDTDWYKSTFHELQYLYPLLSKGGVLIIDDYGNFQGAKKAVDKYFSSDNQAILLNRIDYTGRLGIKI